MGWEQSCGRRPNAAASSDQVEMTSTMGRAADSAGGHMPNPLYRGPTASLESRNDIADRKRDIEGRRDWSTWKHVRVVAATILGLWLLCYVVTSMMIEALLRVTS